MLLEKERILYKLFFKKSLYTLLFFALLPSKDLDQHDFHLYYKMISLNLSKQLETI